MARHPFEGITHSPGTTARVQSAMMHGTILLVTGIQPSEGCSRLDLQEHGTCTDKNTNKRINGYDPATCLLNVTGHKISQSATLRSPGSTKACECSSSRPPPLLPCCADRPDRLCLDHHGRICGRASADSAVMLLLLAM